MDSHETDAPVWSRPEDRDYTSDNRADAKRDAEAECDAEAEPVVLAEDDIVVIKSHDAIDEPQMMPLETPAHAAARNETVPGEITPDETAAPAGTVWSAGTTGAAEAVPAEPASDSAVPESAVAASEVPESVAAGLASEDAAAATTADTAAAPAAGGTTLGSQGWSEIKAMFVDDPGESVKLASRLVERAINDLVTSLNERQDSLASWEDGDGSDTEGLRNVLRSYRSLFEQIEGMSGQFGFGKANASGL
jgi:hypothetical protein